ncbi:chorismate-binding protein [Polaribacter sp. R77954]|uniref:chorismate-binding protein n=1 Tax=Polaribacter sp. R77954 TaxID=3093870 RepID=UPI0037CB6255
MNIFDKITTSYNLKLPFAVYRKPKENIVSGFIMMNDDLDFSTNFSESGFVFAPFDADQNAILFALEKSEFITEKLVLDNLKFENNTFKNNDNSKQSHIAIVEKAIQKIKTSKLQKVVISRKETVAITDFDLLEIYQKLLKSYQNAFVSVWFHPKVGLWLGATPETLLQMQSASFKTMSLAGTQVYQPKKEVVWKSKELEEQQLVTDFIENQLANIASSLKIDKTETIKAGNLLHLRTKVEGVLDKNANLKAIIRALHPTPAVCGLPRNSAKEFLLANENYNRSFYTGFLGELNINQKSSLFVNLRCMEIHNNIASIYIGGGITKDSDAEKEWEETVSKSITMKKVL